MYDYNEKTQHGLLKLKKYNTYQERLDFIQEHFFKNNKYKTYYSQSPALWLGVKLPNKPHKIEHVKTVLDYIATYLLSAKEHSTHNKKKRYLELLELKANQDKLDSELYRELSHLSKEIIYHPPSKSFKMNRNLVFFENSNYKSFLIKCKNKYIDFLNNDHVLNYTESFCLKKTEEEIQAIEYIEKKVKANLNKISHLNKKRDDLKKLVRENYKSLKENKANLSTMIKQSNLLKKINDEIKFLKNEIHDLYKDYYFLTEHQIDHLTTS